MKKEKSEIFNIELDRLEDCIEKGKVKTLQNIIDNSFGLGEYDYEFKPLSQLKKVMEDDENKLPPIIIGEERNGKHCIYDGHHRVAVAKHLGKKTIRARFVRDGDVCEWGVISRPKKNEK